MRGGLQFAWGVAVLVGLAGCSSTTNVSGTGAGGAGYHDATGRGFIINGVEYPPDDISPVAIGVEHTVIVTQTDSELAWDMDGDTITAAVAPSPVTDRVLALGAWTSVAAFYDVVFEGTLD